MSCKASLAALRLYGYFVILCHVIIGEMMMMMIGTPVQHVMRTVF